MNVATSLYPLDDERMSGFMNRLDTVNALADQSPGFVWRLQSDTGNATDIDVGGDPLFIVNMSVWSSPAALFDFVYRTAHREVMAKRRQWFQRPAGAYQVLWWLPAGEVSTAAEGLARLERLNRDGPGPAAFTFKSIWPAPDVSGEPGDLEPEAHCAGWE